MSEEFPRGDAPALTRAETVTNLRRLEQNPEDGQAVQELFASIYPELQVIARQMMARQRKGHTLQTNALVNEAYLKLVGAESLGWESRGHFLRIAARAMRQILVNHARDRNAAKRGGGWHRVTLSGVSIPDRDDYVELLSLDHALEGLMKHDSRMAEVVELRVFGGITAKEVAGILGVSKRTVDTDLKLARLWLADELGKSGHGSAPKAD